MIEQKRSFSRQVSSTSGVDSFVMAEEIDQFRDQNQDFSGIKGDDHLVTLVTFSLIRFSELFKFCTYG